MKILAKFTWPAFFTLFVACPLSAAPAPAPKRDDGMTQELLRGNIAISRWFDGVAEGLDLFLAGKRTTNRPNETSVRLTNDTYSRSGEGVQNSTGVGVNLKLPNLEEYWHLKFSNRDDRQEKRGVRQSYLRQAPPEQNPGATVGLFKKLGDVRASFEPRIELQDPLRISHSITFESVAEMKTFEINPKLEFFATPDKGTGTFTSFNVHIPLSKIYSLTLITEGEYIEKPHLFIGTNGFSVGQIVTNRKSFSYNFILSSNNRSVYHLETYSASVTWSHVLYHRVLDYSITPHLDFEKIHDFRGIPGLNFSVSLNF